MRLPLSSLKVAIVASSLRLAGAEKQTFYQARELCRAGVDTRLFHLGGGGHYVGVLRQTGIPVRQIFTPNKPWLMLAKLANELRLWRPQILLAAQFSDLLYAGPAGRLCRTMTLGGVRSDGVYELNSHGCWSKWMIRMANGLIANSLGARQNLTSRGVKPKKIAVLSNVIDLKEFDQRSMLPDETPLPPDRIAVTAVGSLHPCKRFDRFLEALALARRSEPRLTGIIAGSDCGAKAELAAKADALGLTQDDIIFTGEVSNVPALLSRSAMLALTSEYEGFPNVILEAMAARLPVISMPAGDAGHIVRHDQTGYVVKAGDARSMADFMVQLARKPGLRRDFGGVARRRVEQEYNSNLLANRLFTVFHDFARQQGNFSLCRQLERYLDSAAAPECVGGFQSQGHMNTTGHQARERQVASTGK